MTRLEQQLAFIVELDRLKLVERQSLVTDGSRRENSAEHSWHLAMVALVLAEHAGPDVDVGRAIRMCLVHDIVEIDAGDVIVYADAATRAEQHRREQAAADRLFSLLPDDQGPELRALWEEFEARATPTARFAGAVDRLQPMLLNLAVGGGPWREHGITAERVLAVNAVIGDGSPELWEHAQALVQAAVADGVLDPGPVEPRGGSAGA